MGYQTSPSFRTLPAQPLNQAPLFMLLYQNLHCNVIICTLSPNFENIHLEGTQTHRLFINVLRMLRGFLVRIGVDFKNVSNKIGVVYSCCASFGYAYTTRAAYLSSQSSCLFSWKNSPGSGSTKLLTFPVPNHSELVKTTFPLPASSQLTAAKLTLFSVYLWMKQTWMLQQWKL